MEKELFEGEELRQIPNFEKYYVSNFGRVWSEYSKKFLKPTISERGNHKREYVSLGRGNKKYVHQLVAICFLDNPNGYTEVDHIDTNGLNNHVDNLKWVTHVENMDNTETREHLKKNTGYYVEIEEIATGRKFNGYEEAAIQCGVSKATIGNHVKGKVKNPKWKLTGERVRPEE